MRVFVASLLVVPFLLLAGVGTPSGASADEDAALIERVGALLEPRGKLGRLIEALGEPEERRDLGFGGGWARFELYGNALTLFVDVVTWKERVAGIRVTALDEEAGLKRKIRKAWVERVRVREGGLEVETVKASEMGRLHRAVWKGIAEPPKQGPSASEQEAFEVLTNPLAELTFGHVCYEDGSPPAARVLADSLWKAGARPALQAVLVGANPEGRVYAAEALLRFELEGDALGTDLRATVAQVLGLDLGIRSCAGCLVSDEKAAALVNDATLRDTVLCRVLVTSTHMGRAYVQRRVVVYHDGTRMARRLPAPTVLACIPMIDRGPVPEKIQRALRAAVKDGAGFEKRDGLATYSVAETELAKAPPAVRALLASLPAKIR